MYVQCFCLKAHISHNQHKNVEQFHRAKAIRRRLHVDHRARLTLLINLYDGSIAMGADEVRKALAGIVHAQARGVATVAILEALATAKSVVLERKDTAIATCVFPLGKRGLTVSADATLSAQALAVLALPKRIEALAKDATIATTKLIVRRTAISRHTVHIHLTVSTDSVNKALANSTNAIAIEIPTVLLGNASATTKRLGAVVRRWASHVLGQVLGHCQRTVVAHVAIEALAESHLIGANSACAIGAAAIDVRDAVATAKGRIQAVPTIQKER